MIRLIEDLYNKNEYWYHISQQPVDSFYYHRRRPIFLGQLRYINILKSMADMSDYYIYKCNFKRDLDIFDPSINDDLNNLKNYVYDNNLIFNISVEGVDIDSWEDYFDLINRFQDWQLMEDATLMRYVRDLGYDGIVTVEFDERNIAVFDGRLINIIEEINYSSEEE